MVDSMIFEDLKSSQQGIFLVREDFLVQGKLKFYNKLFVYFVFKIVFFNI